METKVKKTQVVSKNVEIADLFGKMFAFNNSLKLYHWHVTGKGSYAQHMALDEGLGDMIDALDRIVETAYAMHGDLDVVIPQTLTPKDIVKHAENFFDVLEDGRELFSAAFVQAIIDDYQEAVQQLLYRLKRLQ